MHAVIDSFGGAGWEQALAALTRGGVLVISAIPEATRPRSGRRPVLAMALAGRHDDGQPREFRDLCEHVGSSSWRPAIDSVHPLADMHAAADRLTAPERFGKVVLRIG